MEKKYFAIFSDYDKVGLKEAREIAQESANEDGVPWYVVEIIETYKPLKQKKQAFTFLTERV